MNDVGEQWIDTGEENKKEHWVGMDGV